MAGVSTEGAAEFNNTVVLLPHRRQRYEMAWGYNRAHHHSQVPSIKYIWMVCIMMLCVLFALRCCDMRHAVSQINCEKVKHA